MFNKIKGIVNAVAPTLGSALGGPLGGMAAQVLSDVLSTEDKKVAATPEDIGKALEKATPEQFAALKKAENDFEVRMRELEVDVFKLETADVQNARSVFRSDWTPRIIAIMCVLFFGGYIALVTIQPPGENSDTIVSLVLGYLGGIVSSICSFYFGASHKAEGS